VGMTEGALYLWDAITGKELRKIDKLRGYWGALSFSPDGKTLAAGDSGKIHLLEVSTGKELYTLQSDHSYICSVAFSPSGRLLASAGYDATVQLWEVNAGLAKECHQFRSHKVCVTAVAFSPDGRRLVSGSSDSTALVWDVTGLAGGQARVARLTQGELTACRQALSSTDAARAYQTLRTLAAVPDQTVPVLAGRLLQKSPGPEQVARLLADLDSEDFRVRSQAAKELEKLGEAVEPALRQALKKKPPIEVHRRIQQLLDEIDPPNREGVSLGLLRGLRVVEVLEWINTPAARELLGKLAAAPPREEVGQQAKAALKRLRTLRNP
jgi:Tol biopolymer transport system component